MVYSLIFVEHLLQEIPKKECACEANFWDLTCLSENSLILPLHMVDILVRYKIPNWRLFSLRLEGTALFLLDFTIAVEKSDTSLLPEPLYVTYFFLLKLLGKIYFIHRLYQMCLGIGPFFIHHSGHSMYPFHMEIYALQFGEIILYHSYIIFFPAFFFLKLLWILFCTS